MIGGCYVLEAFLEVVGEQPHYFLLVDDVGHVAVDKADKPAELGFGEGELFGVLLNDAHLAVVVDDVEVGGCWEGAEFHIEGLLVLIIPVGEEEGDEEAGIEKDIEAEPPADKLHWDDREDDALPLSLIRLVF